MLAYDIAKMIQQDTSEEDKDRSYYKKMSDLTAISAMQTGASSFAQLASSAIDYSLLKTQSIGLEIQADSIETQAQMRANQLREQLNAQFGNAIYGTAVRGIRATSPMVVQNLERSAKNMGQDIQLMHQNAQAQASALRAQAKIMRIRGKAKQFQGIMGGLETGSDAYLQYGLSQNYKKMAEG